MTAVIHRYHCIYMAVDKSDTAGNGRKSMKIKENNKRTGRCRTQAHSDENKI